MSPPAAMVEGTSDTQGFTIPDPLSVESVASRRNKAGKLVAGVASTSDVELFKGRGSHAHKPLARRWDDRLSAEAKSRKPSSIKASAKYLTKPGIISLGGGLPSPDYFPFSQLSLKVPRVGHFSEEETDAAGAVITAGKHDLATDKSLIDMATVLNYGQGTGAAQLLRWLTEHTEIVHNPPYQDWSCTMSIGSTSSFDMILRMFAQPNECVLSEEYTFSSAVETARPFGMKFIGVRMDEQGMLASSLDSILSTWDPAEHNGSPKPFLVYTVPTGQNPTGATQSAARRREIYAVAQKHDLLIIEDEPYYFLQMQPYTGPDAPDVPPPTTHREFLSSLVPSYLSLDTDGRVMRLDSFSKVVAPGTRVGWVTGPAQLVERYHRHADVSTQAPSGFSQLALFKLLDEHWGHGGYLDWLLYIRLEYTRRRDVILAACEALLPRAVVRWAPPMAGMFHWMQLDWRRHPLAGTMSLEELEDRIWLRAIDEGALLIKGSFFTPSDDVVQDKMFFRATYAAAPEDKIREAIRRFGDALRDEFGLEPAAREGNGVYAGANGHA